MEGRLSERQRRMLEFIREYGEENSRPPTVREIGQAVGISSTSVVDYNLRKLAQSGHIKRDPDVSRGIELMGFERRTRSNVNPVPVVGRIAAGRPIEAIEQRDQEQIELPFDLAPDGTYALRVKGKSMIEDHIDDGDIVIVQPQQVARDGEIVVALMTNGPSEEGEATLKRFYHERDRVRLQPANSEMEPIYVSPQDVQIRGKVVSVIRRL